MSKNAVRMEEDLLGGFKVPRNALYGVQTARSVDNFPVLGVKTIGEYPELIEAMLKIKKVCAITNGGMGFLDTKKTKAMVRAIDLLLKKKSWDQFPVHHLHGGSGTPLNMNVNEVIANMAEEILGGKRGQYKLIHPNDDVNKHQSTNDVVPTAAHSAIINKWKKTRKSFDELGQAWLRKGKEYKNQKRIARTHYQDALKTSYADLFGSYASFSHRMKEKIDIAVQDLYLVGLGGTAVGNKRDVPVKYFNRVIIDLRQVMKDKNYRRMDSLYDANQHADQMIGVGNAIELFARGLIKIVKDLRVLNSGPEAGLGEIHLPSVQPGSSIMPGKVNPVIPEFVAQNCFQVCGKITAAKMAVDHGEFDLNVWRILAIVNILDSLDILDNIINTLSKKSINGLVVDAEINNEHANTIIAQLTEAMKKYGYAKVSDMCKKAKGDVRKIRKGLDGLMR